MRKLGLLLLVAGCRKEPEDSSVVSGDHTIELGEQKSCASPVPDGPGRFTEEGAARGLSIERPPFWGEYTSFDGSLVATDLEGDGDPDLLLGRVEGAPDTFVNDGTGHFTRADKLFGDVLDRFPAIATTGATDLNGDGLPEILMVGLGGMMVAWNKGNLNFSEAEILWIHDGDQVPFYISYGLGDMDGDGDLDIALPALDTLPKDIYAAPDPEKSFLGAPVQLLRNDDGTFVAADQLTPEGTAGFSMYAIFSDREGDGDQDLLVSSVQLGFLERLAPQAFYRNDPDGWHNDAPITAMDLSISGMGGDLLDLNGDGLLDYCFSDTGPVLCMLNDGQGAYYDVGLARGMIPEGWGPQLQWSGWTLEIQDYDHDGNWDAFVGAGDEVHPRLYWPPWSEGTPPPDDRESYHHDTLLWGSADGSFVDRAAEIGFDLPAYHYGGAAADFDGDGWLEMVLQPQGQGPAFWQNHCGAGAWLDVDLVGEADNREAIGAVVEVHAGSRRWSRQVLPLRGFGQSPSEVHFGLGDVDEVDWLRVRWPDNSETVVEKVGTRREVVIRK
ncbi:MAG TPA: CRTAC1 family protein [Myxococcota bacterium]|nr:CRTAC1 family protein [Myxococcota bacterium]